MLGCLWICPYVEGISFVYNLRVSEITRRQSYKSQFTKHSIAMVNFIDQYRDRFDCVQENIAGPLCSYLWLGKQVYVKLDAAYGNVRQRKQDSFFSCSEPDDILFSAGYNQRWGERFKWTISGKLGIPTHQDNIVRGLQFGTGHLGIGAQLDIAYAVTQDLNSSLMAAARYIRYFPATIYFPKKTIPYEFNIGNLADLIVSYNTGFKTNRFEFGYNASIVFFPTIEPFIETPLNQAYGIRSNFYSAYIRFFRIGTHMSGFITGLSYGFDNVPKLFKNIISVWLAWGINF